MSCEIPLDEHDSMCDMSSLKFENGFSWATVWCCTELWSARLVRCKLHLPSDEENNSHLYFSSTYHCIREASKTMRTVIGHKMQWKYPPGNICPSLNCPNRQTTHPMSISANGTLSLTTTSTTDGKTKATQSSQTVKGSLGNLSHIIFVVMILPFITRKLSYLILE